MSDQVTRRSVLRGLGGAALLSLGSGSVLAGCSSGSTAGASAEAGGKVKLPTYLPYAGVKPDLPGNAQGVLAGYSVYPADPVSVIKEPPGTGGTVTAMTLTYGAVPPAVDRNRYWQELNKRLGTELAINVVPNANYADKLATVIAGGDLPDMVQFFAALKPPQFQALLRSKFQNLNEFLSGDAVKDYPFLANIPTPSWRNAVFGGGIYGVPIPRGTVGTIVFVRDDLVRAKGLQRQPKSFAEFRELCKGLTDAKNNRWALGHPPTFLAFLEQMAGAPNTWREENGKFTHHYETEEAKQALGDMLTLLKDGVFHPDAAAAETDQVKQWLQAGTVAINRDGAGAWSGIAPTDSKDPDNVVGAMLPPGRDGGKGVHWAGGGAFGIVSFPTADKAKITELLGICNWLAAPFGTAEYQFRKYGLPGVHYELKGSEPVLNKTGETELSVPVKYLSDSPAVLYESGKPALTKAEHAFQEQIMPLAIADPSIGLFSETQSAKGAQLDKQLDDTLRDIFAGRKQFSDWDQTVQQWRRNGGDKMRAEYEQSYHEANG
ncbi:putative aldouronate transport system substrate-binding protein [Kribbella sp. VKM Ac-2527]|jgi:putative aldouronate transport system substrate-binding protein|uniref:Putative aldouronate transport system substrate-binding protein n=1 Tax=Kribbella caucasensis TaxID=2512215 RepID=A0A4R6KDY6_9ACTN|nr:extracellular solute-binding protein [Kribbella sp. VKM Ac-2527]TDO48026.1 putative aldouronate transport system substrate-binding protein [Kribbella sp. VKM Ac-2527]